MDKTLTAIIEREDDGYVALSKKSGQIFPKPWNCSECAPVQ